MVRGSDAVLAILFLCFAFFFGFKVNLGGAHFKGLVMFICLLVSSGLLVVLRWPLREKVGIPLAFFVPMLDRVLYAGTLEVQVAEDALLYLGLPLSFFVLLRFRPKDLGLSFGRRTTVYMVLVLFGGAVVMSVVGLAFPSMTRYYPIWASGPVGPSEFVYNETLIAALMFCGEFFFRGAILFSLSRRSFWGAVIFQALPYAWLHLGKPSVEVPYALIAGVIFGWADLKSRSILPSWVAHAGGSALFDLLVLITRLS